MQRLLDTVLDVIRARRDDIEACYGIRLLGVVGSVARGEERPDSDVDITYKVTRGTTLFKLAEVTFQLEDLIGRSVDLVDPDAMRQEASEYLQRDLVLA